MPDSLIIPIEPDVLPDEYKFEIGLYELTTMQRLAIEGQSESDSIVKSPIGIME